MLPKPETTSTPAGRSSDAQFWDQILVGLQVSRQQGWLALAVFAIVLALAVGWIAAWIAGKTCEFPAVMLCLTRLGTIVDMTGFASSDLETPSFDLWQSLYWKSADLNVRDRSESLTSTDSEIESRTQVAWNNELEPYGTSVQLGLAARRSSTRNVAVRLREI